jgi:hypothetical protein
MVPRGPIFTIQLGLTKLPEADALKAGTVGHQSRVSNHAQSPANVGN